MRTTLRSLTRRGHWKCRRLERRLRRSYLRLRQAFLSPLRTTSLALSPFVLVMALSAALLRSDTEPSEAPAVSVLSVTHAEAALEKYGRLHWEVVRQYAGRFNVSDELANLIYDAAWQERIDPEVAFRLVRVESSFRTGVVGPAGAVGLSQIRPSTAQWLDPTVTRDHLFEAETNLRLGFRYLRLLLGNYRHDMRLALLAYNRGPGTVAALIALGQDPGNGYASRVLGIPTRQTSRLARVDSPVPTDPEQAHSQAPSGPARADAETPDDRTPADAAVLGDPAQADAETPVEPEQAETPTKPSAREATR